MLSRDLLRSAPDRVRRALADRGQSAAQLDEWLELDTRRRVALAEVERRKQQRNLVSQSIGRLKAAGGDAAAALAEAAVLKREIEELEAALAGGETALGALELGFPNLPHESVPRGADESANRVERTVGEPPRFAFEPRPHWELGTALGILDFERGAKLAGARFTVSFGAGAALERALAQFMLDLHVGEHGYTEVLPPYVVNRESLVGTGQLPKFEDDLFRLEGHDGFLIPTAEVPVTNLHRDEILEEASLPLRYVAWTPCFRSEAGSYGKDVRGLIRQHQFHKVELVHLATPETSYERARGDDDARRARARAARPRLPRGLARHRRPRLLRRQDLRPRGLAPRPGRLSRDLELLELRGVPGAPRRPPLPAGQAARRACSTLSTARGSPSAAR